MDLDDKMKAILNSPLGQAHYRRRPLSGRRKRRRPAKTTTASPKRGSWKDALRLHRRLKKRLKKYGDSKQDKALLKVISACKKSRRCADAACPKCNYAVQGVMNELHLDMREGGIVFDTCITIVPQLRFMMPKATETGSSSAPDRGIGEAVIKFTKFRRWLDTAFDVSFVPTVIAVMDVNWNEYPNKEFKDHARPHLHGLTFGNQVKAGEKVLRGEFQKKGSINKPVEMEDYDGDVHWFLYMLKIPDNRMIRRKNENGKWARPATKSLRVQQQLQQAVVLHEIGWAGRLYLRGVELIEGRKGWRLALTEFTPAVQKRGR